MIDDRVEKVIVRTRNDESHAAGQRIGPEEMASKRPAMTVHQVIDIERGSLGTDSMYNAVGMLQMRCGVWGRRVIRCKCTAIMRRGTTILAHQPHLSPV